MIFLLIREWVYATSLSQQMKDRRVGQYLRSDCTDSAEICQTFFEKTVRFFFIRNCFYLFGLWGFL